MEVLNAENEGLHVYVLLSDGRILVSRALGDKHCAEIHAKQVMEIKLTPTFLIGTLKYTFADDL